MWKRLVVAVVFTAFPLGAQQMGDSPQNLANQLWAEFERVAWDSTHGEWVNANPTATCQAPKSQGYDPEWCNQCASQSAAYQQEWEFFALDLREPPACRLLEYRFRSNETNWEPLAEVHRTLAQRLTARYGNGEPHGAVPQHYPVGYPAGRTWKGSDFQLWLELNMDYPGERGIAVLRMQVRRGARAADNSPDGRFDAELIPEESHRKAGTPLDLALAAALRSEFPEVADMLSGQIPPIDEEKVRAATDLYYASRRTADAAEYRAYIGRVLNREWGPQDFYREIQMLLNRADGAPPERHAALLLAAERLLTRILHPNDARRVELLEEWLRELEPYGITFHNLQSNERFAPVWEYDHDLLWRVWEELPETEWGERAFVALLEHGWYTKPGCGVSSDPSQPYKTWDDRFPAIIEQGEMFLRERSRSARYAEVLLLLAQAYETWWSLSLAEDDNYVPSPAKHTNGAEAARQKAVGYYEEVMQAAPQSELAAYAVRHLPRLKLHIDTNQRRFYCALRG